MAGTSANKRGGKVKKKAEWGPRRIIAQLIKMGYTKWRIHRRVHVQYRTVERWANGQLNPTKKHVEELRALLKIKPDTTE